MAHKNRWLTELKNGDLPVSFVKLPDGTSHHSLENIGNKSSLQIHHFA
jgi:hypothetical protein